MSWPREKEEAWSSDPMMLMKAPSIMVFFRPSLSPSQMQSSAPKEQPSIPEDAEDLKSPHEFKVAPPQERLALGFSVTILYRPKCLILDEA